MVFLLDNVLQVVRLIEDVVRGMVYFDPNVLMSLPMEQVLFSFTALLKNFRLRSWNVSSQLDCRVNGIRGLSLSHLQGFQGQSWFDQDMDVRLAPLPALRSRKKLFQLFQLSCFWLTETSPERPRIGVQNVDTSDARCRLFLVFLPTQSYLANVHNLMVVCTTNSAMTKCQEICSKLESDSIAADPWVHIDSFGRAQLYRNLSVTQKSLLRFKLRNFQVKGV